MKNVREQLRGKWRITETGTWDRDSLDLVEAAFIAFDHPEIGSEFRFGVVVAALDCAYSDSDVGFDFHGSDEGTEVWGEGWAEPDGSDAIRGEIAFRHGDETTFRARRW